MSDNINGSQSDEGIQILVENMIAPLPEAEKEAERKKWKYHFELMDLQNEAFEGKRGYWWPDCAYGIKLHGIDPVEWSLVETSAVAGFTKFIENLSGFNPDDGNLNQMILRFAELGEDVTRMLSFAEVNPDTAPVFLEAVADAMREGRKRRRLPESERIFQPRTMRDLPSFLMTRFWHRGIRLKNTELPPFAFWTDQALSEFFQMSLLFSSNWQAIRDRRKAYNLKHTSLILVDGLVLERRSGEGEEIEMGDRFRLKHCSKSRQRKAK